MKKYILLIFLVALLGVGASAQVKVTTEIDSTEILIGQQTDVRIEVVHPEGLAVDFPNAVEALSVQNLEVVGNGEIDEHENTPEKGLTTSVYRYKLTSFEPALYSIPKLNVTVGKKNYETNILALKVLDMPVDTVHTDKFFGPKEISEPVYTWQDWMPMLFVSLLLLLSLAAAGYVAVLLRKAKQVKAVVGNKVFIRPDVEATKQIGALKTQYGSGSLTSKDYYTELVTILRRYVTMRYGISAGEMTSYELVNCLMNLPKEQPAPADGSAAQSANDALAAKQPDFVELREILNTADLTKFAKLTTDETEDKANLLRLAAYIDATRSDELKAVEVDDSKKQAEKQRRRNILTLQIVLSVAALIAFLALVLIGFEVYELIL